MIAGIILAGGKGKRINSTKVNKVTLSFLGKPIIIFAVELLQDIVDKTVVVVGAYKESVRKCLEGFLVIFAHQRQQLGTAHATEIGLGVLENYSPTLVLVGYGDHMMFYKKGTVRRLIEIHQKEKPTISLFTSHHPDVDKYAWARILRDIKGEIIGIIEQKDATLRQREIKEFNPGFYCFDFNFLKDNITRVAKSPITGEYYLTDLIKMAINQKKKVVGLVVPFEEVGIGINKEEELEISQKLYSKIKKS